MDQTRQRHLLHTFLTLTYFSILFLDNSSVSKIYPLLFMAGDHGSRKRIYTDTSYVKRASHWKHLESLSKFTEGCRGLQEYTTTGERSHLKALCITPCFSLDICSALPHLCSPNLHHRSIWKDVTNTAPKIHTS